VAALSVQQGSVNPPLMQQPTFPTSNLPPTSNMPPATSKMPPATSKMPPATSNMPPATSNMPPATSNMPPASSKPPSSVAAGTVGSASVLTMGNTTVNNGTPESLARRQLMAELKEASNLMAESVTPEAATFWRNHVVELQARLRALHGDGTSQVHPSVLGGLAAEGLAAEGLAAEEILENSERLLTSLEHEEEESISGYKPPSQYQQQKQHEMSTPRFQPQVTLNDVDPSIGSPMVDVVAPADLPGGYTFEAEIEDRRFLAIVPKGGVRKGETFSCFMRDLSKVGSEVPVGRWRDSLTSCFVHGICHPNVLNALWCPLLALGQIMTRVGLDFMGNPAGAARKKGGVTPWGVMGVVVIFWTTINLAVFGAFNYKWSRGMELSAADWTSLAVVNTAGVLFTIYAVASTRASVREKYLIRESRFLDLEDCCCATFCMPCTICQMSRHTASYNDHEGICCNARGYIASITEETHCCGITAEAVTTSFKNVLTVFVDPSELINQSCWPYLSSVYIHPASLFLTVL
jgi:Cys-rich protein (TIGR01571 family)